MPFQIAPYDSCGFCQYISRERECVFVAEDNLVAAFVNHRQYERGAMLVIPKQHRETILDASDAEITGVYTLVKHLARAMERAFGACAVNVFQNNGIRAGQHVPHMHVHVVPRYETSDPERLFLQREFAVVPIAEQRAVAATLRSAL
jgi:histidine triad (HIT) family protein